MQFYAVAGQHAAALRQYETCQRILQTELQAAPSPETQALYERIRPDRASKPADDQPTLLASTLPSEPLHSNLRAPLTALLGRETECEAIEKLLRQPERRLITLTGPGGVGKTRLAQQLAAAQPGAFPHGVYFVSLAPVREASLLPTTMIQTLGLREDVRRTPLELLQAELAEKQMLLVLDNFEHIIEAAPVLTELLSACPHVKMLVTSRETLRVRGEQVFPVHPLPVPARRDSIAPAEVPQYAGVQLFVERARAVQPDLNLNAANVAAIGEICARLDGLPLAIELAAVRIPLFAPPALLHALDGGAGPASLQVLDSGLRDMPDRHQTLRGALAWSYHLLTPEEQHLFRRLSLFAAGFSLEAAEVIRSELPPTAEFLARAMQPHALAPEIFESQVDALFPDTVSAQTMGSVTSLVNKNLVHRAEEDGPAPRFVMLETMREFGLALLQEHDELDHVQRRYAGYYLAFAARAGRWLRTREHDYWLEQLEIEHNNLRAVLDWAVANREVEIALRLAALTFLFWLRRGYR
jgi:predicted ATPase